MTELPLRRGGITNWPSSRRVEPVSVEDETRAANLGFSYALFDGGGRRLCLASCICWLAESEKIGYGGGNLWADLGTEELIFVASARARRGEDKRWEGRGR